MLQPYHENFNKRLVKSPKLYFYDTGLLSHLLNIRNIEDLQENRLKGHIFENLILAEYQKKNHHQYLHMNQYFWQDSNAHEVDLLLKNNKGFDAYEIKATQTISSSLFKQLDHFEGIVTPEIVHKTLIYGGSESQKRSNHKVLSWREVSD